MSDSHLLLFFSNIDNLLPQGDFGYDEQRLALRGIHTTVEERKAHLRHLNTEVFGGEPGPVHAAIAASSVSELLTDLRFRRDWYVRSYGARNYLWFWDFVWSFDIRILCWKSELNDIIVDEFGGTAVQ